MFKRRPAPPRQMPADLREEIEAMCHARQIEQLALPRALRRDVGLDCGCISPEPVLLRQPW